MHEPKPIAIGDYDSDGIPDLMVKFSRAEVIAYILDNIDIENRFTTLTLTIAGYLNDGTPFQGSDTIKIIMPIPRCMHHRRRCQSNLSQGQKHLSIRRINLRC
jgi:hypothetical protein